MTLAGRWRWPWMLHFCFYRWSETIRIFELCDLIIIFSLFVLSKNSFEAPLHFAYWLFQPSFKFSSITRICIFYFYFKMFTESNLYLPSRSSRLSNFLYLTLRSILAALNSSKFDSYQFETSKFITPSFRSQGVSLKSLFQELHIQDEWFTTLESFISSSFSSDTQSLRQTDPSITMATYHYTGPTFAFCGTFDGSGHIFANPRVA